MSIWRSSRPAPERRAVDFAGVAPWLRSAGYSKVDGGQIENAEQSVAVSSAVDLIASIASELPIDIYTGKGQARRPVPMPTYLEDPAGDGYGLPDWIYQICYSWLYRGNMYGEELARSRTGFLTQMSLFHPDRVSGWVDDDGSIAWMAGGQRVERMNHKRVNPVPGQIQGISPISKAADTIGISLSATRFGKGWFDADAQPVGILRNSLAGVNEDQARTVKSSFMAALRGNREPVVMGRGWEFTSLSVNPEESQFLGTMEYTEAQCARIFGPGIAEILGYGTGSSQTYANVQDRDIQLLKYSVNRWLRRLERVLFEFLPRPQYAVFNRDALLETNTMQRYQAYALALQGAPWKEVNEVREKENLKPIIVEPDPDPEPAEEEDPEADDSEEEDADA